jgi:NADH-quinone oxidoreductase subunit G
MATVETQTVTLTVNGREVTVPKGYSLVEAAVQAGVEIPVFCYEPRLGAAIGACRMCLCDIEGMPKLQTACTTPAADGMVVNSVSDRALEGQHAVLEFILLNHPLDCPVCDKGGECPLQDLTFRYGPGSTRMTLPKRTHEKPIPISPLIKLDRERCILCYRCTRFSEAISGDMQLVTEQRGANSIITTFEGRPYENEFSGNVTELCPVGALTSTTYRFRARPWEFQNIPTICGGCAVGCNISATIREGQVTRVLSRNHPQIDEGWLCDRGRYAITHLRAEDRVTTARIRGGRGLEEVAEADALEHIAERLRSTLDRFGGGSVAVLASGEQTNEEAYAWRRILDDGLGGGIGVAGPEGAAGWDALRPHRASIADLDSADVIVVAGHADLSLRAPVLELRIRNAVGKGARLIDVGPGGTRLETLTGASHVDAAPGTEHAALHAATSDDDELARALGERSVLIWSAPLRPAVTAVLAHVCQTRGCRVLPTPLVANELGCQDAGLGTHTPDEALAEIESGRIKAIVLLGADPVGDWSQGERWRTALERAFFALQLTQFQSDSTGWVTTLVPATDLLEKTGTVTNLEGRTQRVRAAATAPPGVPDGYAWASELAGRLGVELPYDPPAAFAEMAEAIPAFAGQSYAEIGERAPLPGGPAAASAMVAAQIGDDPAPEGTTVVGYRELMAGRAVDRAPHLHFQRRTGIELSHDDARDLGIAAGDRVSVEFGGRTVSGPAVVSRRLRRHTVRLAARVPYVGAGSVSPAVEEPDA